MLEFTTLRASQTGFILQALIIMAENEEQLDRVSPACKQIIAYSLLSDMIHQATFQY